MYSKLYQVFVSEIFEAVHIAEEWNGFYDDVFQTEVCDREDNDVHTSGEIPVTWAPARDHPHGSHRQQSRAKTLTALQT